MLVKTYGIYGRMEQVVRIPVGRGSLTACFSGGHVSAAGEAPATFKTADEAVQTVIERSVMFRSGQISLVRADETGIPEPESGEAQPTPLECSGWQEAASLINAGYSIPKKDLSSEAKVRAVAKRLNLSLTYDQVP